MLAAIVWLLRSFQLWSLKRLRFEQIETSVSSALDSQLEVSQSPMHRYNQELEEDSAAMQQERLQLQQQAESLAERLEAVLSNKFMSRTAFDADTPIDKTLALLQELIKVCLLNTILCHCFHLYFCMVM